MNIRAYTKSDFKIISKIYELSKLDELINEKNDFELIPLEIDKKRYTDFIESWVYVVEIGSHVVGFFGYREEHLSWLFVHPEFRGKGVGKIMIDFIKTKLKDSISLSVVASNASAISLYKKQGFKKNREITGEYNGIPVNVIEMKFNADI